MIGKWVLILLFCMPVAIAWARNDWYEKPVTFAPGATEIGELSTPVTEATVHVRSAIDPDKGGTWGIMWGGGDASDYYIATITFPPVDRTEYYFTEKPSLRVDHVKAGVTEALHVAPQVSGCDAAGGFNSLKLCFDGECATLYYGCGTQHELSAVPFDAGVSKVSLYADSPIRCRRIQVEGTSTEPLPYSDFTSVDQLLSYVRTSTDPTEGVWEYMDRDMKPDMAVPGGFYTFATVRHGDVYDIIYLRGADVGRDKWQPLMVKGTLRPTIFEGNYDMLWYAASGMSLTDDVNAQLSDDHAILTLRFPLFSSQMRFRRLPHP